MGAFYVGPPLSVLHDSYAKRGKVDTCAPIRATRSVLIEAAPPSVWSLLSDPAAWHRIDPNIRLVSIDGAVAPDTAFTWKNGSARIKSRFAVVSTEREITWTGVSFGAKAVHRHALEPLEGPATRLTSEESMSGLLLPMLFSAGKLQHTLDQWLAAIKKLAEQHRP